ncbi:MAG: C25 family cysteine peptidase, partial [candidate division WOR-3 bacterium]
AGSLTGDSSTLVFDVIRPAGTMTSLEAYLNAVDIKYERRAILDAPFNAFFPSPEDYSIQCSEADAQTFVFDITELNAPKMFTNQTISGGIMQLSSSADSFQMLYFTKLSLSKPAELKPSSPGRLRTQGDGCEYVVIAHEDFYHAIMPLVEYRSRDYLTKLVQVDDIYDDFSFGKYDPLAIKHFLYYTMQNWSPYPKYVLLVGDATYDYKNNLGKDNPPNFVPMYEYGTYLSGSPVFSRNLLYEGEYVNFGQGEAMCLGRITVRNRQEVRDYIDKLITYETGDIVGPWAKRVILSADDEYAYGFEHPTLHTGACERNNNYIPDSLYDIVKIYMISYPPLGAGTAEKGNAREIFIREFNKGALLGLFYGHGNTHQLAHEVLFLSPYMGRISNGRRTPFFYFGSCNVGRFNDSDYECLGEEFVRATDGAIGTIAATAGTSPTTNESIGQRLSLNITNPDTALTMGECSVIAREGYWFEQYLLIGDPATKFRKIYDQMYLNRSPDSLRPLERMNVVADNDRYHLKAFVRDTTHIEKFDASTADKISSYVYRLVQVGNNSWVPYGYRIDGKEIYTGYWEGDTAKIIAPRVTTTNLPIIKLSSIDDDQSGMYDSIRVYGTAVPVTDNTGPEVSLYEGGRLLRDNDWVDKEFTLTGRITDSSGVNLLYSVESTNGFYLYVNSQLDNKIDLRDYFYYVKNSFTSGEFNVPIDLPESVDTITVNVVDNNFNQTVTRLVLNTELFGQVAIEDFLIYPNPLRTEDGLWFTFDLTRSGLVQLKIFTIAGRLIKSIDNVSAVSGYNQIYWDGRDNARDEISNGVYIVKAYVEADNSRAEAVEKFIIAR